MHRRSRRVYDRKALACHGLTVLAALLILLAAGCNGDDIGALPEAIAPPGGGGASAATPECTADAAIGDLCGGGIVYEDAYGISGDILIAALADEGVLIWQDSYTSTPNANSSTDGRNNTGTFAASHPASYACQIRDSDGYADWYLPAPDELSLLAAQSVLVGGFSSAYYWTSEEASFELAWTVHADTVSSLDVYKDEVAYVRCIRRPA